LVADKSRSSKRKKSVRRKSPARKVKAPTSAQRLETLEELVSTLLQAALRGRLLPSERRPIKAYLQSRKQDREVKSEKSREKRCPACRSPLINPRANRCPWCSVLLTQAGRGRRSNR
jgi:hypothetical protein